MKLLQGEVVASEEGYDRRDDILDDLREQLRASQRETATARRESSRALAALRKQLHPLHEALKMVFGELDAAGVEDSADAPVNPRTSAVWESWKSKLPGRTAQIIDALLLHGEMNSQADRDCDRDSSEQRAAEQGRLDRQKRHEVFAEKVMTSEARPRSRRIVNPEHCDHALRRIVNAWLRPDVDLRKESELRAAMADAQRLLGMTTRDPVSLT